MKYTIQIIGGKEILATEQEANVVIQHWKAKDGYIIAVGRNTISVNTIRSITQVPETGFKGFDEKKKVADDAYDQMLLTRSALTPTEKARKELQVRILPAWVRSGGLRTDPEMMTIYNGALDFFGRYAYYPYYPSRFWWSIIENRLKSSPHISVLFQCIILHDEQIEWWIWRTGQKKATSEQIGIAS